MLSLGVVFGVLLVACAAAPCPPPVAAASALSGDSSAIRDPRRDEPCSGLPVDASFVVVASPPSGARLRPPFDVAGCSRTFEGTVTWRLLDRSGLVVARGIAAGGSSDGPEPFRFRVAAAGAAGLHHLEVDEPRVTDEGFPPGRTVLPLVLSPAAGE